MLYYLLEKWNYFVLFYFLFINMVYLGLMVLSFFSVKRYLRESRMLDDKLLFRHASLLKPISILAPAYNEERTVVENISSLLKLNYPQYEIILINDGSADNTLKTVIEHYQLKPVLRAYPGDITTKPLRGIYASKQYPNLLVVDKENGGKADALNTGINISRYPLVIGIDTDSLLEKEVLLKMIRPFLNRPETVAVGGVVRILNGCDIKSGNLEQIELPPTILPKFQIIEYFRAFLFGRVGWEAVNMLLIISGAFGMFSKSALLQVGGFRDDTVGEDMDLVVRLHEHMLKTKQKYHISFMPEPVCWTEAPETMRVLGRQRNRWHRGLLETVFHNKKMIFNPTYGRIGMFAMPFAFFVEGLGPIIEVTGVFTLILAFYLGVVDSFFSIAFLFAAVLLGVVMSSSAIIIEEFTFRRYPSLKMVLTLFFYGILENFGYRQINVIWRLIGIYDFLRKKKSWGKMTRKGFKKS
ncbi:MAG: glycosyltransferase [Deltaproteobacteria bacterium]|nr:glycosyltransferase [Deltaproteobacteria bacterium]